MNHEQLLAYINQVIEDIFTNISNVDDLLNDKKTMELIKSITDALNQLGISITKYIPGILNEAYTGGLDEATKALQEAVAGAAALSTPVSAGTVAGVASITAAEKGKVLLFAAKQKPSKIQKQIHLEAVNAIVEDSIIDMQAAIRTAKLNANDTILETLQEVKTSITKGIITGDTRKTITAQVLKDFREKGLTSFVTKDGKNLPLDYYAKLVSETKLRKAHTDGAVNRFVETGVTLAQIFENSDTCPICARYDGMVVSLTGKDKGFKSKDEVDLPPYHPHCRGVLRPFIQEFKTSRDIQNEKDKWKEWNPKKDVRTPAQKKAYEKEQKNRQQANAEKKQFVRWQSLLGAEAPKTLGAFRRMKRANTPKFQDLQSMYRSNARKSI